MEIYVAAYVNVTAYDGANTKTFGVFDSEQKAIDYINFASTEYPTESDIDESCYWEVCKYTTNIPLSSEEIYGNIVYQTEYEKD